jgi:hypothetical protein
MAGVTEEPPGPLMAAIFQMVPFLPVIPPEELDGGVRQQRATDLRALEGHRCMLCMRRPGVVVLVARPGAGHWREPRWLDLCPRCADAVRRELAA